MRLLAIDPGNVQSAYVVVDDTPFSAPLDKGKLYNDDLLGLVVSNRWRATHLAIEKIASYGMTAGATLFDTCEWGGRFIQAWRLMTGHDHTSVFRREVKLHLCGQPRAKDANIRQALLDAYPATGGGKCPQVGTKTQPGPLYGVSADVWAALGVAATHLRWEPGPGGRPPTP